MISQLPLKFGRVEGDFHMSSLGIESLVGSPEWVGGDFILSDNVLFNLDYFPNYVGGDNLVSLVGLSTVLNGNLDLSNNNILKFLGLPEPSNIKGTINLDRNIYPIKIERGDFSKYRSLIKADIAWNFLD